MRRSAGLTFLSPRVALLLLPVLMGAKGGCGAPDAPPTVEKVEPKTQSVSEPLQAVSVEPASGFEGQPTDVMLIGAGFEPGLTVTVSDQLIGAVTVQNANTLVFTMPALPVGSYDLRLQNPEGGQSTLRRAFTVSSAQPDWQCAKLVLNFDTDKSTLGEHARLALNENLSCYQAMRSVRVEGHTDSRGSTSYNLALGQRRAASVVEILAGFGVQREVIRPSSLGEERPLQSGNTASAWAQNRRVEIHAQ